MKDLLQDVKCYEKGTHNIWTDPYISQQLLKFHLDPDIGAASRSKKTINQTIHWILKQYNQASGSILDLGCGPGLYTSELAVKGYDVTGVDFSQNSIAYAKQYAKNHSLNIRYICGDYLDVEIDIEETYDMVMMIYCDFGALIPIEREKLIKRIYKLLKSGGIFIFDAVDEGTIKDMHFQKGWQCDDGGFWQVEPHMLLSNSRHYPENKALLQENIVIDEVGDYKLYRFWNHYFNTQDIENMFRAEGFRVVEIYPQLMDGEGAYNDQHVTFYKVTK